MPTAARFTRWSTIYKQRSPLADVSTDIMAVRQLILLALLSVLATASENSPKGLSAAVVRRKADNADIELSWRPANCPMMIPLYTIYLQANDVLEEYIGQTQDTHFIIRDVEYSTNYTVRLATSNCWNAGDVFVTVDTGHGNPHKVSDVRLLVLPYRVTVTIAEAKLIPEQLVYVITVCSYESCFETSFERSPDSKVLNEQTTIIDGLQPSTSYNLSVRARIQFGPEMVYDSEPFNVNFTTSPYDYPKLHDLSHEISTHYGPLECTITLRWKIEPLGGNTLSHYLVEVTNLRTRRLHVLRKTKPEARVQRVSFFDEFEYKVKPVFDVEGVIINGTASLGRCWTYSGHIPAPEGLAMYETNKTTGLLRWKPPLEMADSNIHYTIAIFQCPDYACRSVKKVGSTIGPLNETQLELSGLVDRQMYKFAVRSIGRYNLGTYEGQQKLIGVVFYARDLAPVTGVSSTPDESNDFNISYDITWKPMEATALHELVKYRVFACTPLGPCVVETVESANTHKVMALKYFMEYTVTVQTVYRSGFGTELTVNTSIALSTPGRKPLPVRDIQVTQLSPSTAQLNWLAPKNAQDHITLDYVIMGPGLGPFETRNTSFVIEGLSQGRLYEFSIRAMVKSTRGPFSSDENFHKFFLLGSVLHGN